MDYGFYKLLDKPFKDTIDEVSEKLKMQGFGILTRIDIHEKFKEKLGVDFKKYVILGACSPPNAHKALQAEENIGLMLPCNVCVYEKDGKTAVSVIKPSVAMSMINNPSLGEVAAEVESKLKAAFDAL